MKWDGMEYILRVFNIIYICNGCAKWAGVVWRNSGDGQGGQGWSGGIAGESECISTLDHKCEEIQERKRVLCNEFLM